jgi:hypothetical protein
VGEQRGDVAGRGADLQNAMAVLDGQEPQHAGDHARLGVGRGGDAGAVRLAVVELDDDRLVGVDQGESIGLGGEGLARCRGLPPGPVRDEGCAGDGVPDSAPCLVEQTAPVEVFYERGVPARSGGGHISSWWCR